MTIDSRLVENLLHQEEGPALDFKQEQYLFDNADVGTKAELLKDILALANSWRLTTAYILIGVKEIKGRRNEIIGVENHLDDGNLHQFVNGKTQKAVEFSYLPIHIEGLEIGVIQIPMQERPFFLTRRFGGLPENEVFVRDGSSTRVATPDEVARMGAEQVLGGSPQFLLEWAELDSNKTLPSPYATLSMVLEPLLPSDTFAPRRTYRMGVDPFANPDYSQDIIACAAERSLLTPLGFRLRNESNTVGRRIRFTGRIAKLDGLVIREWVDDLPSRNRNLLSTPIPVFAPHSDDEPSSAVREFEDSWRIVVDFGDVRPRDEVWTNTVFFVGSTRPCITSLRGDLRGDNLPEPVKYELEIHIDVERRSMTIDDVAPYLHVD